MQTLNFVHEWLRESDKKQVTPDQKTWIIVESGSVMIINS
jgi:hypothetical protein